MPKMMVRSLRCMSDRQRFIISIGQGAPPAQPVRNAPRSKRENAGWFNIARYIVGTPPMTVQASASIVSSEASGSNHSDGNTITAPWVRQVSVPTTMPAQ